VSAALSASTRTPATGGTSHLAGLDGVRAIAVAGVLLYHTDLPWFRGGFLGVDVFFVLSGFLITALLSREFERTSGVDLRAFYGRRLRRLVPALLLLLATAVVVAAFVVPDAAARVRTDGLAALLYASNWWLIAGGQSYFEFISRPPLLQHLWSLAIEEQFYLLWPLAVWTVMRVWGRRGLLWTAVGLAALSTWWMARLSVAYGYPEADPSRIYFGTDTHCMGLLLGAALATVWQPWNAAPVVGRRLNAVLALLGVLSCAGVSYAFIAVGERTPLLYRGGFLLLSLVVCGLIVSAGHPGSSFGQLLGRQPLRWLGERSYGLYLWHWPIYVITRPGLDVPVAGAANLALRLAVTAAVAEVSYRFVERPIRDGAIARFFDVWRTARPLARRPLIARAVLVLTPAIAAAALVAVALAVSGNAPRHPAIAPDVAAAMGILDGGPTRVIIERRLAVAAASDAVDTVPTADSVATAGDAASSPGPARVSTIAPGANDGGLTAVGDSVLLGTRLHLERSIRGVQVDAEVGRQPVGVLERLRELHREQLMAPTVLIHLGTNGHVTESQLRRALRLLSDRRRVIVVNAHAPRRWVPENNDTIARVVRDYANTVLIDWAVAATDHPEFFASDDIHLSGSGQRAFVHAVIRAGGFPATPPPAAVVARAAPPAVATLPTLLHAAVLVTDVPSVTARDEALIEDGQPSGMLPVSVAPDSSVPDRVPPASAPPASGEPMNSEPASLTSPATVPPATAPPATAPPVSGAELQL
jgi:peptidoglycan/LPS O-acetylase OafA/YrhL